jgi:hypothetical protein
VVVRVGGHREAERSAGGGARICRARAPVSATSISYRIPNPCAASGALDLEDLGKVFEVLDGMEAVVHLAVGELRGDTEQTTFRANTVSTFNVFAAACQLELQRAVGVE